MEEVDSIILHFLRQLNVNINPDTKSVCELPVDAIIELATKCLCKINNSLKLPTKMPSSISQRIELASQIASICKDLGYKNDVGYQTFLYYNEADLRQVFMFLIENLPNESKQNLVRSRANDNKSLLLQEVSNKIGEKLNSIWIPSCCSPNNKKQIGDFVFRIDSSTRCNTENEQALIEKLRSIKSTNGVENSITISSENDKEFNVNEHEINKNLKELKELSIILRQKLDALESEKNVMDVEFSQVQRACERVDTEIKNVLNILEIIGITDIESFEDYALENVMEKVHNDIPLLHKQSEELTFKNLSLKMDLDKLKNNMTSNESERSKCQLIIEMLKEEARSMKEDYKKNQETRDQLKNIYEKSKGGNKRSLYTKRILEIISNVDKQNMEIKKILEDTRQLQKEINSLEGQLDRCFSIADETLFRDAKKDDQAKKAYKLLALLHSECGSIVTLVNDTGAIARDIVDLEDNIKIEKTKRTEDTLKKIHLDLTKMQTECQSIGGSEPDRGGSPCLAYAWPSGLYAAFHGIAYSRGPGFESR
ncbi:unnamed protein product [Chilo suppressalis]|uniref:Coiled-coil domain-containing protein 22 homolog n=1 Tax=Chilo suppressalis TaxID=168631 RepID=A0ABN8AUK6_CHISP|nr:unnamed protein product [Chilo suppressalis]